MLPLSVNLLYNLRVIIYGLILTDVKFVHTNSIAIVKIRALGIYIHTSTDTEHYKVTELNTGN
jgi:hypothetical protein